MVDFIPFSRVKVNLIEPEGERNRATGVRTHFVCVVKHFSHYATKTSSSIVNICWRVKYYTVGPLQPSLLVKWIKMTSMNFIQSFLQKQDAIQGQILNGVLQVWIQSSLSPKLVA